MAAILALAFGRREWRLEPWSLVPQRRFGDDVRTLGEARGLELVERVDSDGAHSYRLQAIRPPDPPLRVIPTPTIPPPCASSVVRRSSNFAASSAAPDGWGAGRPGSWSGRRPPPPLIHRGNNRL
ncbi:hypothetical protein [Synechococcus sp. ATX 2A4]|uniref:hypothetical protein n=1 Tax=Synechococcus sp. ATX 2A4 TaxID=2823727 RepID=UPI0020CFAC1D|nr:hypothetical protein [Synechococcus sp. ATX 2A4]